MICLRNRRMTVSDLIFCKLGVTCVSLMKKESINYDVTEKKIGTEINRGQDWLHFIKWNLKRIAIKVWENRVLFLVHFRWQGIKLKFQERSPSLITEIVESKWFPVFPRVLSKLDRKAITLSNLPRIPTRQFVLCLKCHKKWYISLEHKLTNVLGVFFLHFGDFSSLSNLYNFDYIGWIWL